MVNNNAKPNACSVSLKIDTKILYLYRKWWWSGGGRRRKMQDNCIFLPRVKSRRCANILRASGYLEYSRIWLLFSPDNTTSQQSSLRPGNGGYISNQALVKCVFTATGERGQSTTGTSSMSRWIVELRDNTSVRFYAKYREFGVNIDIDWPWIDEISRPTSKVK